MTDEELAAIKRGRLSDTEWHTHVSQIPIERNDDLLVVVDEAMRARKSEAILLAEVERLRAELAELERDYDFEHPV